MLSKETVINVSHLGKRYEIYSKPYQRLLQFIAPKVHFSKKVFYKEYWALKDISFEIKAGEAVGIVGKNGSGKSTLLQMIAGTLQPTEGEIQTKGKVAALLELGSGFNMEYTGRDNVYLNAALLGLSEKETNENMEEILAFADIGDFIDQPVKTYSSGMVMRLAFAVQAQVKPDILIVDEALAVGDELFQAKCIRRIEQLLAQGTTLLFVSHSVSAVNQLCQRAVVLNKGKQIYVGEAGKATGYYNKILYGVPIEQIQADIEQETAVSLKTALPVVGKNAAIVSDGDTYTNIRRFEIFPQEHRQGKITMLKLEAAESIANDFKVGEKVQLTQRVKFLEDASSVISGFMISTVLGVDCYHTNLYCRENPLPICRRGEEWEFTYSFAMNLAPGDYIVVVDCQCDVDATPKIIDICYEAFHFTVSSDTLISDGGIAVLNAAIEKKRL